MTLRKLLYNIVGEEPYLKEELDLSDTEITRFTAEDKTYIEKWCPNVTKLNLTNTCLRSLENLPMLPKLEELVLSRNKLMSKDFAEIHTLVTLETLRVDHNQIKAALVFRFLNNIKSLRHFHIRGNEVNVTDKYMWKILPFLETVDGVNKQGEIVEVIESSEDEDVGQSVGGTEITQETRGNPSELNEEMKRTIGLDDTRKPRKRKYK